MRNKLWFYGSGRRREALENILGVTQAEPSNPTNTDPATHSQLQVFASGKVSFQLNAANRFVGFMTRTRKAELPSASFAAGVSQLSPWVTRGKSSLPMIVWKGGWQAVKGNLFLSAQAGHWQYHGDYLALSDLPATRDIVTLVLGGANTDGNTLQVRTGRHHASGTVTWYKPEGLWGKHELKSGVDYMRDNGYNGATARPAGMGDYRLVFQSGTPYQFEAWNSPVNGDNIEHYTALYATDSWSPSRRLTLNLGLRYVHDNAFVPAQCSVAGVFSTASCIDKKQFNIWNSVAPRLFAAYDITGHGKTVVKGGWGRFDHKYVLNEILNTNPFSRVTTTYFWHDTNGNKRYEPGEVNLDLGGTDYVSQTGSASGLPDPNEPQPKQDQFYAGFEHELFANLAVRATGVYSRYFNVPLVDGLLRPASVYNIPITKADPGPDGVVGTRDDPGTFLTYYDYSAAFRGPQFNRSWQTSLPDTPEQTFKTIEVAAVRRLANGWQLTGSYSATRKHIPFPEGTANNPNSFINVADDTWEWIGRLSGAYQFPYGVLFSANYDSRSGTSQARTVLLTGGTQIPNQVVNAGPIGSLKMPSIRTLDLRAQKTFALSGGHKVTARLNVYNSLNANTITAWTNRSGASYLRPLTILPPRILEVGASYAF